MDLKSLKRKELQALCKKHGIPANSTNSQLIESLSSILEDHDKAMPKGCLKGSGGSGAENLGFVGGVSKKKVTFVVEDEGEEEFEEITSSPVGDSKNKVVNERRSTRSRGLAEAVVWSPVIEKTKKKSLRVGMQGVRRNDKLISGEVPTTRSLRNRAVVVGGDEGLVTDENSRGIRERRNIAGKKVTSVTEAEVEEVEEVKGITLNPVGNSRRKSVVSNAVEIKGRSTRSLRLPEAVVWSPDIEKNKKSSSVGTEGVRKNDKPISNDVLTTRSLRNRVVVAGGDEGLAADQNSRRAQKRKFGDKKDEDETGASKLEEVKFVGRKNLRKRSRGGDFVGDEAPNRRSSRSHTKSEENIAVEEVDVGRSNKRRKKDTDGLMIEKGVDEDVERANRTKGMAVNSDATESRDVTIAVGQKKPQSKGKTRASKRGGPTTSTLDSEVVILPARRSSRDSPLIGTSDEEVKAVKKGKLQKHVKDGEGREFVSESVRRSTRGSSELLEDGTSLPVAGAEVVTTGRSLKQGRHHGSEGGEVIAEPIRRSTRSSSDVGQSDGEGQAIKKGRSQKSVLLDSEVVAKPVRRPTRTSSTLQEDEASLFDRKPVSVGEAVKKSKSQKQAKSHGPKGGGTTTSLRDSESKVEAFLQENEAVTEPEIRSTHGSAKLLDGETSLSIVKGNTSKDTDDHALKKEDHASALSTRRSTRGSSMLLEDGPLPFTETFGSGNEVRKKKKSGKASKNFDLPDSVPDNEPATSPSRRSTRSSSKVLEDGSLLEAVSKDKPGKKSRRSATKEGDSRVPVSDSPVATKSARGSSFKHISLEVETSLPESAKIDDEDRAGTMENSVPSKVVEGASDESAPRHSERMEILLSMGDNSGDEAEKVGKKTQEEQREDDLEGQIPEAFVSNFKTASQTKALEEHEQFKELTERSVQSASKNNALSGDKVEASKSEGAISVSGPPIAGISFDLSIDTESGTAEAEINDMDDKNAPEIRQSLAKLEEGSSLMGSGKDLDDVSLGSQINGNESSVFELASKGSGVLVVNVEGSSETEENVSRQLECSNLSPIEPSSAIEVNGELTSASAPTPSVVSEELSTTFDTEISTMALPKEPEPVSIVEVGTEHDDIITGYEAVPVSSSQFPKSSEELSLRTDSHASFGFDLEEPSLKAEIRGASEDVLEYDGETDIVVPPLVCKSSEELTLIDVTEADPEIDLEEPDSKVEDDQPREDVVPDYDAINVVDPMTSDIKACSDCPTSCGTDLEEPQLKAEICGANEDGLDNIEETEIVVRTSVCESSERTLTSVAVANPEIDIKEPESKVEVDSPSKDIVGDDEAKKIFDPMISDTEICTDSLTSCGTDLEELRLKAEICGANEDGLGGNEETDTVVQTTVCESLEELTLTSVTGANPEIELKEPDSKVEVDRPSEDIVGDDEAKKIFDPMTYDTEVCSDSRTSRGTDLVEPRLKAEICGANEDGLDDNEETDIVIQTSVCESSEGLTLTSVTVANPEIDLKEPDSKMEVDHPSEDVEGDDEAIKKFDPILDPMTSDTEVSSDSRNSYGTDLEEPRLKEEICGANEDGLQDDEETDIVVQTSVYISSEELTLTSVTVANPEIDLKEPDSKEEVDRPSEDIVGDDEAKRIFDPMTSDTEVCAEPLCDIKVEGSDSKLEVQDASKGDMEQNEATTSVSSVMSCKSTGILSPTSLNEASYHSDPGHVDTLAMNKEDFLIEASGIHCKTSEASMAVFRNVGDTSSTQTIFDNEMEDCKANLDTILNSHQKHGECDTLKTVEAVACDEDPQLYKEDLEVSKETWVTSMISVTVNDDIEIEDDSKDVEKNEHELRSSSPRESQPAQGTQSSPEELVDAEQSDFTQSLYDKEPANAEKKLRVSFDDKFSAENSDSLMSPVAFVKSEGTSYATPLEHKDEPLAFEIDEVTEITEGKYSVDHRSSTQLLDASNKLEKQLVKDYDRGGADVGSASINENTSTDTVCGDAKKAADQEVFPTLPVTFTSGEEILPISCTEAPTLSGNEGSTMQVDVQDAAYIRDNDNGRNLSDHQEVTVNAIENLGVDFVDGSSKSAPKEHVNVEQPNANSDSLPETSIIMNRLTDVEIERTTVFGAVVSEEMDNIESWESEANAEGYDGTKADSMASDEVDHLDDVDLKRDEAFLLHDMKCFSGELHTDENVSHTSVNNSASGSAEELPENVSPSTYMGNAPRLPNMDIVLPREEHSDEDCSEKASDEDGTPNSEEYLSTINVNPLANQQECEGAILEEHVVDDDAVDDDMNMDQYFGVEGEQSNKYQGTFGSFFRGTFESFEQASNADEACVSHCEAFTERLFHMEDEAAASMSDDAEADDCQRDEENLGHGKCEEFSEIDSMKMLAFGDDEMKGAVSRSSVAVIEEASPYECGLSSKAENLSRASAKSFVGVNSQATYSTQQSEDLGDGRTSWQQTPGVPTFLEDGNFSAPSKLDKAFTPKREVDCSSSEIVENEEQNEQNTPDRIGDSSGRSRSTSYFQRL